MHERAGGEVEVFWKTPLQRPLGADLRPELPARCSELGAGASGGVSGAATLRWRARCEGGLVGSTFRVVGLDESRTEALLRLVLADGRRFQAVLRAGDSEFRVPGKQRASDVAGDYLLLGVEHILGGPDHLLFVLGLVLLVSGGRALLWTVTAFTVGHSITLSLAVLGVIGVPQTLVEVGIAASILVLAVDLTRSEAARPSRLRRSPWAIAGLFGLLHGLGFAAALAEAGLPQDEIPLALLSFNLGIELGQLAFVASVLLVRPLLRPLARRGPGWLARVPAYGIGSLAAYWCFERTAALF